MIKGLILLSVFTHLISNVSMSQDCSDVLVSGRVEDTLQIQSFYNLMIVNKTSGRGVFGNPNGSFSVYAKEGDEIIFSIKGYPSKSLIVMPDSNCQDINKIYISRNPQVFEEVVVYPIKTLSEIKEEREQLSMRETKTVTGINVLESPITALYERFSKRAKSIQLVAEMEYLDNQAKVLKELLRTYIAYDVIYLSEENFEEFIYFLNINEFFLKTASDYDLILFIKDKLEHFKVIHPDYFEDLKKE